jgi:UDP-N-acetylmuramate: L-alanyl-gamma-D-glutamyl-meso-diaminopimelate ligase
VYDDFAHHPSAIETTVDGLRRRVGAARILAVLEPRSHTMRMGVHHQTLAPALSGADEVWLYAPPDLGWDVGAVARALGTRGHLSADVDALVRELAGAVRHGDHVLIMSNGGFAGLHGKLLAELRRAH